MQLESWNRILPEVATFAPVLAYDRPGLGLSEWDNQPATAERSVAHLRTLLETLDLAPPYILVGHAWGGALVRYYAGRYSDEVAGIVYIEPTDVTLAQTMFVSFTRPSVPENRRITDSGRSARKGMPRRVHRFERKLKPSETSSEVR